MKIVLAGLSKCGTKTMVAAFEKLGYNVCDIIENYEKFGDEWERLFLYGGTAEDFRRMYENIDVVTDTPSCHFWEEIMEAFPDVKIVFTQRRNEHEWFRSMENQFVQNSSLILQLMTLLSPTCRKFIKWMDKLGYATYGSPIHRPWFKKAHLNGMLCRQRYRQHNNYVLQKSPKKQLLVYDFHQGWEPLCKFLGKPVPNEPFPHENKKGGVTEKFLKEKPLFIRMKNEMFVSITLIIATVIGLVSYFML